MSVLDRLFEIRVAVGRSSGCFVDWATELLVNGYDTPNLVILAGLSETDDSEEVRSYFLATLEDLGVRAPDDVESRLRESRALASAALRGDLEILHAVSRIHEVAVGPLNHPPCLQAWCDLDGGFTMDGAQAVRLDAPALEEAARSEARRFLDEDPEQQLDVLLAEIREGPAKDRSPGPAP